MKIKEEQKEQVINFGAFNYSSRKIASILELNQNEVDSELKNKESELSKLIQKGKDMADYVIDLKLFEMAKTGDIKALNKLDNRKRMRK